MKKSKNTELKINITDDGTLQLDNDHDIRPLFRYDSLTELTFSMASDIKAYCAGRGITNLKILGISKACMPLYMSLVFLLGKLCDDYDLIGVSSYSGKDRVKPKIKNKPDSGFIKDQNVLIVDTLVDTGKTMECVVNYVKKSGAKLILTSSLVKKLRSDNVCFFKNIDFLGFTSPDIFLVGYGLDFNNKYRNLVDIYDLNELTKYDNEIDILETIIYNNDSNEDDEDDNEEYTEDNDSEEENDDDNGVQN
jgi:hypoxanthine phosphoribosyltransferase